MQHNSVWIRTRATSSICSSCFRTDTSLDWLEWVLHAGQCRTSRQALDLACRGPMNSLPPSHLLPQPPKSCTHAEFSAYSGQSRHGSCMWGHGLRMAFFGASTKGQMLWLHELNPAHKLYLWCPCPRGSGHYFLSIFMRPQLPNLTLSAFSPNTWLLP